MSIGTGLGQDRGQERDFSICTPEDFVNKFGGNLAINKVFIFKNKIKTYWNVNELYLGSDRKQWHCGR